MVFSSQLSWIETYYLYQSFDPCYATFLVSKKAINSLLFLNRQPNQKTNRYNKSIFKDICELKIKQLGKTTTNS